MHDSWFARDGTTGVILEVRCRGIERGPVVRELQGTKEHRLEEG